MVAVVGMKATRLSVWTEMEVVVAGSVWVVTLTRDARADSQCSRSSRIPASRYS